MLEIVKVVGSILGVIVFVWKASDFFRGYLHIELTVHLDGQGLTAKTKVENKSLRRKKVSNARLLVGPESDSPIDTFNLVTGMQAVSTNDIASRELPEERIFGPGGRAVILLPFYYLENIRISDECVTYSAPIPTDGIASGKPYSVRFFLVGEGRLHRSTQDCFTLG